MFNLALAHHLAAAQEQSSLLLYKAVRLYELALRDTSVVAGSVFYKLAIMNNIGQAYKELEEDAKAETAAVRSYLSW